MDDLIEFIGEFFLEVIVEVAQNQKISKWIRYPLIIVFTGLYLALVILFISLTYQAYQQDGVVTGTIFFLLTISLIAILIGFFHKLQKKSKQSNINLDIHK